MTHNNKHLRRAWEPWISILVLILLLVVWELLARSGGISTLFFPAPSRIGTALLRMLGDGELASNLAASLLRLVQGFILGAFPGLLLGLGMGWSPRIRAIMDPFIAAIHPIPKLAIFPLIMIIFGLGELSKIIAVAISAFFPVLINSMTGVRELSPVYFDVSRNYGASRWKTFTRVVIPGSLPTVLSGIRIGVNMALVITIAVELLSADKGLGVLIWFAWQTFRIEDLYVSLFITAILGIILNVLLHQITKKFVPWSNPPSGEGL
jgi:ABC-type nitrate/sulfonate/bicarbonate transport system permease component